jgi:hypothetical protein
VVGWAGNLMWVACFGLGSLRIWCGFDKHAQGREMIGWYDRRGESEEMERYDWFINASSTSRLRGRRELKLLLI